MARRADHTREELTGLALQAGLELIKEEGFSHFSARKVAARIGYTLGTLYHVFGSYDDFILHINACTLDEWFAFMQEALKKNKRKEPLHVLARAYIDYARNHYQQWIALFEHHPGKDREVPDWYREKMTRFFALVEEPLLKRIGDSRKAKRFARVLWTSIHGICVLSLSGKLERVETDSAEVLAASLIDNYIVGLKQ